MSHSILVAGRKGEMVEVEQIDLFKHRINETDFNISVHAEPRSVGSQGDRPLVVSLYETGCRIASLSAGNAPVVLGGGTGSIDKHQIRVCALITVENLIAEIGGMRLSSLLGNSLSEQNHYNQ